MCDKYGVQYGAEVIKEDVAANYEAEVKIGQLVVVRAQVLLNCDVLMCL